MLTVFNCEFRAKKFLFMVLFKIGHFFNIGFAPVVCACFYLYTALSCHYCEIHHAVLGKTITFTVGSCTFPSLSSLSGLSLY